MSFVTCYVQGGLGNQLFIIFTTICVAITQKLKYIIPYQADSPSVTPRKTYYNTLLNTIETEDMYKYSKRSSFRLTEKNDMIYQEIPPIERPTMLSGYFQSRKYIDPIRDFIVNNIKLNDDLDIKAFNLTLKLINDKKQKDTKLIFLHVRRGDYLTLDFHYNLPLEYYKSAILEHQNKYKCMFVIFSDDMPYCKEVFSNILSKDELYFCKSSKDYIELMIMSEMDGAIMANSSFSWWGAYLMEAKKELLQKEESPFIVAPKKWFTPIHIDSQNDRNVDRHNWKFI
jgi:hypothetical protein